MFLFWLAYILCIKHFKSSYKVFSGICRINQTIHISSCSSRCGRILKFFIISSFLLDLICTRPEIYEYLIKIAKQPKRRVLTDVLLETLSIIAYKQPVTKMEIEKIRGVSSDHAVNKLVEYHLVCELGRLDAPGRPLLFGTTEEFLRSFGVHSIDDLPVLSPVQVEEFKQEAEEEMHVKLDV